MRVTLKPVTYHHSTEHEDDPAPNAFEIPSEFVPLADPGSPGCAGATNRGTTDSANDAITGWH